MKNNLMFFTGKIDKETGLPIVNTEPKNCKFGKKMYDTDCYECVEFKKGKCGG